MTPNKQTNNIAKKLGANVRTMRETRHMPQVYVALKAGLDRSYLGRIERGEVNVTLEKVYRLAETLGCNTENLLKGI